MKKIKSFSQIAKSEGSEIAMIIAVERHKFYLANKNRFEPVVNGAELIAAQEKREEQFKAKRKAAKLLKKQNAAANAAEKRAVALAKITQKIQSNPMFGIVEPE
jgi:hypothetical protein